MEHQMRLFLMVANHWSSNAMFAMYLPSLAECITISGFFFTFLCETTELQEFLKYISLVLYVEVGKIP